MLVSCTAAWLPTAEAPTEVGVGVVGGLGEALGCSRLGARHFSFQAPSTLKSLSGLERLHPAAEAWRGAARNFPFGP